jgi:transposase
VPGWLADEAVAIPPVLRKALSEVMAEILELDTRIEKLEKQLREQAKQRPAVQRLMAVPGIGLPVATALVAAVGGMEAFRDGRHLAAWPGLTPKEPAAATGGGRAASASAAARACAPCSSTARARHSTPPP